MIHARDIMSTVEDVQYREGSQITKDCIPYGTGDPPKYSRYPHIVLMISTHGTEHTLYGVRRSV